MNETSSEMQDDIVDDLLTDFIDESELLIGRLNEGLQILDDQVDSREQDGPCDCQDEVVDDMFRAAHSIKGLSAMLGLTDINLLTHNIENIFSAARQNQLDINDDVIRIVYEGCDQLVDMIESLKQPTPEPITCGALYERIEDLLKSAQVGVSVTLDIDSISEMTDAAQKPDQMEPGQPAIIPQEDDSEADSPAADLLAGLVDEEVPSKYLTIFIDETEMSLDSMADILVDSDSANSTDATETLLITSHRIKGSAASVGLNRPARLAHFIEDVLQECRETGRILSTEVVDVMLKCTDALRTYTDTLRQGRPISEAFNGLAHELLESFAKSKTPTHTPDAETPTRPISESVESETPASEILTNDDPSQAWDESLRQQILSSVTPEMYAIHGAVFFDDGLVLAGLKARLLYEKIANLGEILHCEPAADDLDDIDALACFRFVLSSDFEIDSIENYLSISGVSHHEIETWQHPEKSSDGPPTESKVAGNRLDPIADAPTPSPNDDNLRSGRTKEQTATDAGKRRENDNKKSQASAVANRRASDSGARPAETLRVDIERLDHLMNLAGQLVINKARFARIGDGQRGAMINKQTPHIVENACVTISRLERISDSLQKSSSKELDSIHAEVRRLQDDLRFVHSDLQRMTDMRNWMNDLFEAVHELGRVSDGIQKSVMDTRMVPIGPLFKRFKRVIRDITRTNSKEINLEICGEKTELDKRMIDELGDPLIHMVRNSADHGIESPEEREAIGKPKHGTVTLDAFHRGNSIVVQVSDDGKGLHPDKILAKAIEKGIVDQDAGERLSEHEIFQLIWEPGFSTAVQVTEISGRGMGMDIVRSKIEDLNGTVELDSKPGQGATFTIQLPLTLAILPSLLSTIDGDVFATPIESVNEIVQIDNSELSTVHGMLTARVRNRTISVVELKDLFQWNRPSSGTSVRDPSVTTLVILGIDDQEIGLAVDELLGEEDIVIKSLAENYRNIHGLSGASILGDGRVSLILDPASLIELSAKQSNVTTPHSQETRP